MSSSGGNPFTAGQTYQSIIIALVAAGILTTGVMSIIWRRRSRREWAGLNLRFTDGRGFLDPGGGGRNGRDVIGKEPELYDVLVGAAADSETEGEDNVKVEEKTAEDTEQGEKAQNELQIINDMAKQRMLDLDGSMRSGWNPIAVSLVESWRIPSNPISPPQSPTSSPKSPSLSLSRSHSKAIRQDTPLPKKHYDVEVAVLISMPSPAKASRTPYPVADSGSSSSATTSHQPDPFSPVYHHVPSAVFSTSSPGEDVEEELPPLEFAATNLTIPISTSKQLDELDGLFSIAKDSNQALSPNRAAQETQSSDPPLVGVPYMRYDGGARVAQL